MNVVKIRQPTQDVEVKNKESKVVILDADSLLYQCAYRGKDEEGNVIPEYEEDEYEIAEMMLSERILSILNLIEIRYNVLEHYMFVKGKNNFRYEIYPEYKANRPKSPVIVEHLCNYLVDNFGAIRSDGGEADDFVYTLSEKIGHTGIIAACDKDLKQIPSIFYNYNSEQWFNISEEEARYNLAIQILIGDAGDGVNFTPKFGIKKAEALIRIGMSERELIKACLMVYNKIWGEEEGKNKLRLCYKLLKLKKMEE